MMLRGDTVDWGLQKILTLVVTAGEIMLRNGAETSRAEETMDHIAYACGIVKVQSFVVPTGVFVNLTDKDGHSVTAMRRIRDRTINLDRIAKVNELSRRLSDSRLTSEAAMLLLARIDRERTGFSLVPSVIASGLVGGSFAVLQSGTTSDVLAAFTAAGLVRYIAHVVSQLHGVRFTFEFLGGITAALCGVVCHYFWPQLSHDIIISGGLMPLVPGVAITNAIGDLIAGDLLSGLSRTLEAGLTASAVAMGVVIILALT